MRVLTGRFVNSLLFGCLAGLGVAEAIGVYLWNNSPYVTVFQLAYGMLTTIVVFHLGQARSRPLDAPRWMAGLLCAGAFVVTILLAQIALEAYPLSGDEYGYNYVADTLLHGRLWNQPYPPEIRDVLETNYIGGHAGQRLSQYAPGWPVVLMAFKRVGLPQFANAVLGLISALFMWKALRCLDLPSNVRLAVFALAVAAPFTLFNDASFFNHSLTATALLGIVWLDLRDKLEPTPWNRFGIGVGFSILLTTRYEAFALCFVLFAVDALWRHRLRVIGWVLPAAIGAAPLTLLFLAYNWAITGSPLTTTVTWVSPQIGYGLNAIGMDGPHSATNAVIHTVFWFAKWQDFASVVLLPLYAVALVRRLTTRTLRWFDLIFPAVVVFFFFFPDNGGFQFGPRYWYIAHTAMPLTISAALPRVGGCWSVGRWRFDPLRLAAAQLAAFAGFTLGYAIFAHLQVENRLTTARLAASVRPPAMLLTSTIGRRYVPWQGYSYQSFPKDFTRNGLDELPPVAIGLDLGDARTALLCQQMPDRAIYRIRLDRVGPTGALIPLCNGAASAP